MPPKGHHFIPRYIFNTSWETIRKSKCGPMMRK
jgi:hypothetical protein